MLDMILPPSIPTPRDLGRRRFQRRWMGFMSGIMEPRLAAPAPETPRDLFDLLRAARDPDYEVCSGAFEYLGNCKTWSTAAVEAYLILLTDANPWRNAQARLCLRQQPQGRIAVVRLLRQRARAGTLTPEAISLLHDLEQSLPRADLEATYAQSGGED